MVWYIAGARPQKALYEKSTDVNSTYTLVFTGSTTALGAWWRKPKPEPNYGPVKRERKDRNKHFRR